MLLTQPMKTMMKTTKANVEVVISSIIQARKLFYELTAEEIIQRFPHAVKTFRYVRGQLKITLHSLPNSIIPVDRVQ
jgi:hypothetical protein